MPDIEALYNDGQTAKTYKVQVLVSDDSLDIQDAEGQVRITWPRADIRAIDRGKGAGPLRLSLGGADLARLTIADSDARLVLLQALPMATRRARPNRQTVGRIGLWSAGAAVSLVLIIWVILPVAVRQIAATIPQSVQSDIGDNIAKQIVRLVALTTNQPQADVICREEAGLAALARLTKSLTAHSRPEITFRVQVINAPLVNAMALPGGHILLTRGLLGFVGDANELSAVLGHEIGHVALDHAVRNLIKVGGISILFSLLVGDVAGGAVILAVGQSVIAGSYQQAAEREADLHAVELMHAAGFDTRSFAQFFERLDKMQAKMMGKADTENASMRGILDWMSTHPPASERTRTVRRLAKPGNPSMTANDWQALQKICK